MKNLLLIFVISFFTVSCGIFNPRESFETPDVSKNVDRFRFSSIVKMMGKNIDWKNYETFFSDTLLYQDIRTGAVSDKSNIIERLQKDEHSYPRFRIEWKDIKFTDEANILNVEKITYTVTADSTTSSETFTGVASMVIIWAGEYKLVKWYDTPDDEVRKFFTP